MGYDPMNKKTLYRQNEPNNLCRKFSIGFKSYTIPMKILLIKGVLIEARWFKISSLHETKGKLKLLSDFNPFYQFGKVCNNVGLLALLPLPHEVENE
jgi:hypothetical protein